METQTRSEKERVAQWIATKVFYRNQEARNPIVVNVGGARSSKSYSIIQLFIVKFMSESRKKFLTTRKTTPALRITAYKDAIDMLQEQNVYGYLEHRKSEKTLYNRYNGNYWLFSSVDNPEKIKSTEWNYVHMEEANEFTYEDFRILKLRMSGKMKEGERNQMYLSLNPVDEQGWIKQKLLVQERHDFIHSTYKDNPFLPKFYVEELEHLAEQDETYWKIYGLGEFAQLKALIYKSPSIVEKFPSFDDVIYGLDFGFNNPCALLEIGIKDALNAYCREVIYQSRLTNQDLIDLMNQKLTPYEKRRFIYADAEEPARIQELNNAGFNVLPADKNVLDGIDFCKRFHVFTHLDCVNFVREESTYKWKVDRNDNVLDEPVKYNDHFPDAKRYALYTHLAKRSSGVFIGFTKKSIY
jgi:phage terminase large subunit